MVKYSQGVFIPRNPQKYVGRGQIIFRSSWERTLMLVCDQHPSILQWASESIQIPYQDPNTGRIRTYIPDFFIVYVDKAGKKHGDVIEVKPLSQTLESAAKSRNDKAALKINTAKWKSAMAWCSNHGLSFRIMTEQQLFQSMGGR